MNRNDVRITVSADTQNAQTNVDLLNDEFKDLLVSMGKTPQESRKMARMAKDFAESGNAADDLDRETRELLETYRSLVGLAKSQDILGMVPHQEIERSIKEVEDAFDHLKKSGTLSGKELAQASLMANNRVQELRRSASGLHEALEAARGGIAGLAASAGGLALAVRQAMGFESAMADVAKVTGATDEELAGLSTRIKELSAEIPMTAVELAKMAEAGGQLGIPIANLEQFIELAAKMSTAFSMSAEDAGQAVAKLSNVFELSLDQVEAVGDAVNTLGNNMAATEADILQVMTRTGGMAKQFGLATEQTAALSAAFLALGKRPEIVGTGINALLTKLQTAQSASNEFKGALGELGIQADDLAAQIQADPQKAITDFLSTLRELEPMARAQILTKLFGLEYQDDVAALVGSMDQYNTALGLVADKTKTAGAMQDEFQTRTKTTAAQMQILKNGLNAVAINIGSLLLPAVSKVAGGLGDATQALAGFVEKFPMISTLATTLGTLAASAGALKAAFLATRLAGVTLGVDVGKAISGLRMPIGQAVGSMGKLNTASSLVAAGIMGWEIGSYLSNEFEIVRKAGVWMVEMMVRAVERLKYEWELLQAVFTTDTFDAATERYKKKLVELGAVFDDMYKSVEDGAYQAAKARNEEAAAVAEAAKQTKIFNKALAAAGETSVSVAAESTQAVSKLSDAFAALGLDAEKFATGMTSAEASAVDAFAAIASSSETSAEAMDAALGAAVEKISTMPGLETIKAKILEMGDAGTLAGDAVGHALDMIEAKARGLSAPVDQVAEAMERLGIVTSQSLAHAADAARRDFETIRDSGRATAHEIRQAFEAWARSARAAAKAQGDGAAQAVEETIKAQAAVLGLKDSLDQAGLAGQTAGENIRQGLEKAGAEAEQAARAVEQAGSAWDDFDKKSRRGRRGKDDDKWVRQRGRTIYEGKDEATAALFENTTSGGVLADAWRVPDELFREYEAIRKAFAQGQDVDSQRIARVLSELEKIRSEGARWDTKVHAVGSGVDNMVHWASILEGMEEILRWNKSKVRPGGSADEKDTRKKPAAQDSITVRFISPAGRTVRGHFDSRREADEFLDALAEAGLTAV